MALNISGLKHPLVTETQDVRDGLITFASELVCLLQNDVQCVVANSYSLSHLQYL